METIESEGREMGMWAWSEMSGCQMHLHSIRMGAVKIERSEWGLRDSKRYSQQDLAVDYKWSVRDKQNDS